MLYEAASAGRASASRWARGATSFVPSVGVISVLEESTLSIRLSTACTSESSSRSPWVLDQQGRTASGAHRRRRCATGSPADAL